MPDNDDRKHILDYTHVDLVYVEDQRKDLLSKFNNLNTELSACKTELSTLKNTAAINEALRNEVIRTNIRNE